MDVRCRLTDLSAMHPRLSWDEIGAAATAVLGGSADRVPVRLELELRDVPRFGSGKQILEIDAAGVSTSDVARTRRTYEPPRLVELAAIAIAGLALYHSGGHEMMDVAIRGSSADYLIDTAGNLLEVAGRSQASDFGPTWQKKWQRLSERSSRGFYVCVVEFETPKGRLAFAG